MVTKTVVTVRNLHLIETALPSSKYFGIQWNVLASYEVGIHYCYYFSFCFIFFQPLSVQPWIQTEGWDNQWLNLMLVCISMRLLFSSTFLLFLNFFPLYLFVALFVLSFFFTSFPSPMIRFYSTVFYLFIFNCFLFFYSFLSLLSLAISD